MEPGRLIVIEGADGAGKTFQTKRLWTCLRERGIPAEVVAQPSRGPVGLMIRSALRGDLAFDEPTMALLFAADRTHQRAAEVKPLLDAGTWVVCDRYYYSSYVYQGLTLSQTWIMRLNQAVPRPDLTVVLRVPLDVLAARRYARGAAERYEDAATQARVLAAYEALAAGDDPRNQPREVVGVDGDGTMDEVEARIWAVVEARGLLPRR